MGRREWGEVRVGGGGCVVEVREGEVGVGDISGCGKCV